MRKILLMGAIILTGLNIVQAVHLKRVNADLMRQVLETSQCRQNGQVVSCGEAYKLGHRYLCTVTGASFGHTTTECTEFRGIAVTDKTYDSGIASL